jgi:acetyl esterase/lipase
MTIRILDQRNSKYHSLVHATTRTTEIISLYPKGIPNSIPGPNEETSVTDGNNEAVISKVSNPTLSLFLPIGSQNPTSAVIICPGGGYTCLAWDHEGTNPAKAFQATGIAAIVLKYRLPDDAIMKDKSIGPLQDAYQAIKTVRMHAKEWNIDPKKVGVMGFSAGGHLASTAGTHFNRIYIDNEEKTSLRADFLLLVYPVISFSNDSLSHIGSRDCLLGAAPSTEQKKLFSTELQVTKETPPTFLVHAADDGIVPVGNSVEFFKSLQVFMIPTSMHIYEAGGHGFGMKNPTSKDSWFEMVLNWMEGREMR